MPTWGPDGFSIPRGSYYYGPLSAAIATAAQFSTVNPVLPVATIGYESDTTRIKFGDGVSDWNTLPYWGPVPVGASAPISPFVGEIWVDTT